MKKILVPFLLCLLLSTPGRIQASEEPPSPGIEQSALPLAEIADIQNIVYIGDTLSVQVYEERDLSGDFEVKEDGSISYPLLGSVKVEGLTKSEVEALLTKLLEADYLVNPFVQLTIKPSKKLENMSMIMVLGAVQRPSSYPCPPDKPTSLLQAISQAGGFKDNAAIKDAKIIRTKADGEKVTLNPELDKILAGEKKDVELQRNDLVNVPEKLAAMIMVLGAVQRPGSFPLSDKRSTTLLQGIAQAGGFTGFANIGGTKIIRTAAEGTKVIVDPEISKILSGKKQDVELQADDLINVPERLF